MYKSSDEQNRERPMVHIAHTRNQFKSINIVEQNHDFILTLIKRKKALSPFCEFYDSLYVKRKSLHPRMLVTSLIEFGSIVLEKTIVKFGQYIFFTVSLSYLLGNELNPLFE